MRFRFLYKNFPQKKAAEAALFLCVGLLFKQQPHFLPEDLSGPE